MLRTDLNTLFRPLHFKSNNQVSQSSTIIYSGRSVVCPQMANIKKKKTVEGLSSDL